MKANIDYIKSLLIMFHNRTEYDIETALLIYEYFNKEYDKVTDKEIEDVFNFVCSKDNIHDEEICEGVRKIELNNQKTKEEEQEYEKD